MYVTYTSDQVPLIFGQRPSEVKQGGGDFQPTYLVRVEDMVRVPGIEAKEEGYCTLSYSWSYSGDIEFDDQGESFYIDRSQHKIVANQNGWFTTHQEVKNVKFEDVVQQICKDFEIKYIWYDKVCIDQNNKVAKIKEIKQMHKIYQEANFTVAMIPELQLPDSIKRMDWTCTAKYGFARMLGYKRIAEMEAYVQCMQAILTSEWGSRLWTLEEGFMASSLVFVGRNTNLWCSDNRLMIASNLYNFVSKENKATVADLRLDQLFLRRATPPAHQILFQAHQRTTTKPHDRVFALSHMVSHWFQVEINYDLPFESVIHQFYADMAEADLTILCFGKPARPYRNTIQGLYGLPSWTGVGGAHARDRDIYIKKNSWTKDISVSRDGRMSMHIPHCSYTSLALSPASEDMPEIYFESTESCHGLVTTHYVEIPNATCSDSVNDILMPELPRPFRFTKNLKPDIRTVLMFSLTEESDECILLDSPFIWMFGDIFPVLSRQQNGTFKSIGVAYLWTVLNTWVDPNLAKTVTLADILETNEGSFTIV